MPLKESELNKPCLITLVIYVGLTVIVFDLLVYGLLAVTGRVP